MDTNDKYIDRPFNIRPMCFWAFAIAVTVICCFASFWLAFAWVVLIALGLFICQYYRGRDKVLQFFGTSKAFFVLTITFCLITMLSFGITSTIWSGAKTYTGAHELNGVVENFRLRTETKNETPSFIVLSNANFDGHDISGRVTIYVRDFNGEENNLAVGRKISCTAYLSKAKVNDMNVNNRTKYTANIKNVTEIEIGEQYHDLRHDILRYASAFFHRHLGDTNAELMYSMLFGDKSALDDDVRADFATSGMAHALTVSGLHVGVLVGMLVFVFRLCRVRRTAQFPILLVTLALYCYLCGMAYPVMRASMMFLIVLANRIYLNKADLLSSICTAGAITLVVFPYAILSPSFQMSYSCMAGIAFFYKPIEKFLQRTIHPHAPNWLEWVQRWIISGATICLCADITLLPWLVRYFGYYPTLGIFANLLFLPLIVLCFQIAVVSFVTQIGFFMLYPIDYLITFVRNGVDWVASSPFAKIALQNETWWCLCYFMAIIFSSRFIFMRRIYKYPIAIIFILAYCISFAFV